MGALSARQRLIGDLADQDMAERVLITADAAHEVLLQQVLAAARDVRIGDGVDLSHAAHAERTPEDRADLENATNAVLQQVDAREHRRLHGVGKIRERVLHRTQVGER